MSHPTAKSVFLGVPEAVTGIFIFSLTMPAMTIALHDFDPTVVGVGRFAIAAIPAALVLWIGGSPRLTVRQISTLILVAFCLAFGFSWLTAVALRQVTSHHAGIVIGGIPLATALFASLRSGQKQRPLFWIAALLGSGLVIGYGFFNAGGHFTPADLLLLLAGAICGLAYAEGSRLSQQIGTRVLTCWVSIVATPPALLLCLGKFPVHPESIPVTSWLALLYAGLFSTFIAFFFWYRGLALGGIARIGQVQLLQPFFTLASSALILGETLALFDWLTAGGVVACIAVTQTVSTRAVKTAETQVPG